MTWIHAFEILCYALSAVLIWDMARRKNISELKLFLSGCIAGFALELLAVRVTDIYHYNPQFWLNLGREPFQFPVFGGLMWGGLTVCSLRIARRLGFGKVMTALVTGFLIARSPRPLAGALRASNANHQVFSVFWCILPPQRTNSREFKRKWCV